VKGAQARLWVEVRRAGGPALDYLVALQSLVQLRAIGLTAADFPNDGAWEPWTHLFMTHVGDDVRWNIVVSSDPSVLARLYTHGLCNIAVVGHVRPNAVHELRRWHVWTQEPWTLADYYHNTKYVPPDRHTIANALNVLGLGDLREGQEDLVQP
jgi:hypothetical protein